MDAEPRDAVQSLEQLHRRVVTRRTAVEGADRPNSPTSRVGAGAAEQLPLLLDADEQAEAAVDVDLDGGAVLEHLLETGRIVAIFLFGSSVVMNPTVDSGLFLTLSSSGGAAGRGAFHDITEVVAAAARS